MTHFRLAVSLAVFATSLSTIACTDPPNREMNRAQGAIDVARAAGAATYAPETFRAAEEALEKSHASVEQRDYKQALSFALDASERAQDAAKEAANRRAEVTAEVERALVAAQQRLEALEGALEQAAKARVPARRTESARATAADAKAAIQKARAAMPEGDLLNARASLSSLVDQLTKASSEIDAAIAERQARRPVRRGTR
jgi:hypothetical protein